MAKPRVCIFCSKGPLTHEHIYGQWIPDVIPLPLGHQHQARMMDGETGAMLHESPLVTRPNLKTDTHLKLVCKPCNEGWMCAFEGHAKRITPPLILGNYAEVTPEDAALLAGWITKTAFARQYVDHEMITATDSQRSELYRTKNPPPGIEVWIGATPLVSVWNCRDRYRPITVDVEEVGPIPTFIQTFGWGRMLLVVTGAANPELELPIPPGPLVRMWPNPAAFTWPPKPVSDADIDLISRFGYALDGANAEEFRLL